MTDVLTPDQRHLNMSRIRSSNTKAEVMLRRELWHRGFRYKVNDRHFPGSPDIVLPKYRTVIFVHGCFWHGHKGCKYYTIPGTNSEFWEAKVVRNQERDQEVWRKLESKGWSVIIVWECQLKKGRKAETVEQVVKEIVQNGKVYRALLTERRKAREKYYVERRVKKEKERFLLEEVLSR